MTLTFRHPLVACIALAATMWSPALLIGHAQQAAPAQKQTGGFPDLVLPSRRLELQPQMQCRPPAMPPTQHVAVVRSFD